MIEIKCEGTEYLSLKEIHILQDGEGYELKKLSKENFQKLKNRITKKGFWFPFFVWHCKEENKWYTTDGTQRHKVLSTMDNLPEKFPAVQIYAKDKKEAAEAILTQSTQYGEMTSKGLEGFLEDFDLDLGELNDLDLPDIKIEPAENDDDIPEPPEDTQTKLGQIFQLGEHRLMCGDSTKIEDVEKLMQGEKADMVFTDPPYGMKLDADYTKLKWGDRQGKKHKNVIGDHGDFKPEIIETIFNNFGYCKEMFLWGADYYYKYIKNFDGGNFIVWDKTLKSNGDAGSNSEFELLWTKQKHKRVVVHFNWFRYFGLHAQDLKTREHPTQKPLQVCLPFIENYSSENNIIVDLFGGSGTTLIACEKTNRKCRMMELDPIYCDVIIKRWEDYTGQTAKLLTS